MDIQGQFLEAWDLNLQANDQLLATISEQGFSVRYAPRARNVRQLFVHIHNMRLHWLAALSDEPSSATRLKSRESHDAAALKSALEASGTAMRSWLGKLAGQTHLPVFEHSPLAFLAHAIGHEAHHRGQIILALRLAGQPISRSALEQLWDI